MTPRQSSRPQSTFIYPLIAVALVGLSVEAFAESKAPSITATPPISAAPPIPQERGENGRLKEERKLLPSRELSEADYQWLGKVVWGKLQEKITGENARGLSGREVGNLVEEMRRNRDEFSLQLGDLMRILNTRKSCRQKNIQNEQLEQGDQLDANGQPKTEAPVVHSGSWFGMDLKTVGVRLGN